jgi:hypothetical protein
MKEGRMDKRGGKKEREKEAVMYSHRLQRILCVDEI